MTYDEQHISQATLSHLGTAIPSPADEAVDLVCTDSRENMEELESLEGIEHGDEADELTEGEDSNATIQVSRGYSFVWRYKVPTLRMYCKFATAENSQGYGVGKKS